MRCRVAAIAARGFAASRAALLDRETVELASRNDGIRKPKPHRRFGVEGFAKQHKFGRFSHANPARQKQRGRRLRHQAKVDERQTKNRIRRGVDEIAMQHHRRANADRNAFNRGNERRFASGESP